MPNLKAILTAASVVLLLSLTASAAYARSKVGIVDAAGNEIVPCDYDSGYYLGQGLFFLNERDNTYSTPPFFAGHIFNRDGKELKVNIPLECTIVQVILPESVDNPSAQTNTLPPGAIVKIRGPKGFGLYGGDGKSIVEPGYRSIGQSNHGFFAVYKGSEDEPEALAFVVDSTTGKRVATPAQSAIVSTKDAEIVPFGRSKAFPVGQASAPPAEPKKGPTDRFLRWQGGDRFDSEEFKHPSGRNGGLNRVPEFINFLRSYDLIGMPRKHVVELLGGDGLNYSIAYPSCAHSVDSVEFEYAEDKVAGWRDIRQIGEVVTNGPWVRSNEKINWPRPREVVTP